MKRPAPEGVTEPPPAIPPPPPSHPQPASRWEAAGCGGEADLPLLLPSAFAPLQAWLAAGSQGRRLHRLWELELNAKLGRVQEEIRAI